MAGDPSDFDPQAVWQSQDREYDPMTLADIHVKAKTFETKVRRRNMREYLASALVIVGFGAVLIDAESWMMRAGAAATLIATLFVAWQIHRRTSARPTPDVGQALVDFHRQELIRQRDALRSVGRWYLAPFAPGMALLLLSRWFGPPAAGRTSETDHVIILMGGAVIALAFVVMWLLNQRGADRLQKRIDEL